MIAIRPVDPKEADALSQIAFAAKSHWGYPERWMEIWKPQLTFTRHYFEDNESWVAESENRPIAFYTFQDKDGIAWIEDFWVLPEYIGQGVGKRLFQHAVRLAVERGSDYLTE